MSHDRQSELTVTEQAALWCSLLSHADILMRREFVRWLKLSPLHVREMLVAAKWNMKLGKFDPRCKQNFAVLLTSLANTVIPMVREDRGRNTDALKDDLYSSDAARSRMNGQ